MEWTLESWRTLALGLAAVGQSLFVLFYMTLPWYRSFLGRTLFYKALTLAAILDIFILASIYEFSGVDRLFVVLYFGLALGVWLQLAAFIKQRMRYHDLVDGGRSASGRAD